MASGSFLSWAHPRLRGEHSSTWAPVASLWGSSPLTRGTLLATTSLPLLAGLIPAYAGNTPRVRMMVARLGAHPRLRGEHKRLRRWQIVNAGSSPLTRGTRCVSVNRAHLLGLIPAYAGNTPPSPGEPGSPRAHPRLRGEHLCPHHCWCQARGSSPLTRGTRRRIAALAL